MQEKCVLLVENNKNETAAMTSLFNRAGYRLSAVSDGYAALDIISGNQYDMVISELNLPRMSGIELLVKIKEIDTNLPVILISGDVCVKEAVEAMKNGAYDFLLKPLAAETVECIVSGIYRAPVVAEQPSMNGKYAIITNNSEMNHLMNYAEEIANSRASVFIHGESGTGKELFARHIHQNSARKDKPFIALNCAALPETLMESELFGYEKGAFTGAIARKKGKFEAADKGTILLDEISEMDYQLQSKLLRVLQEKEIDRVGGTESVPVDVRIIATTNRNIDNLIHEEKFREDLYYRLNTIPLHLPPLRERQDDIPLLADYFIKKYNKLENKAVKGMTENAITALTERSWKGNVRELENVMERAVLLCKGNLIDEKLLSLNGRSVPAFHPGSLLQSVIPEVSLRELEKKVIFQTLDKTKGNRTHAADILGISVRTLRNKLNEYRQKMDEQ
ncbi:sigma-54-dependent transcriptional regulator [Desulfobacterium sp. N47]|uniref:Transcriptional regulatory protein zraR n=1 Tax=uncultured Desulfobacterium sp. TaxID=201089 RepID=E1YGU7_9BACT|nr:Transcriptional regulatory protein zraR [uncultured Desulfobacterium sp.]